MNPKLEVIAEEMAWALWTNYEGRFYSFKMFYDDDDGEFWDDFRSTMRNIGDLEYVTIDNITGSNIPEIWMNSLELVDGCSNRRRLDKLCAEIGVDDYRKLDWDSIPREWIAERATS